MAVVEGSEKQPGAAIARNVTTVVKSMWMADIRMGANFTAFIEVKSASNLFQIGRKPEGVKTVGLVTIGLNRDIRVLGVDFLNDRIEINHKDVKSDEVSAGDLVINEGAAPRWRWLRGMGGYDNEYECWHLRNAASQIHIELGYGFVRIRQRPGKAVQFCTYEGELIVDKGASWSQKEDGSFDESWFSPSLAQQIQESDSQHPYGGGDPIPHKAIFGVWNIDVSDKKLVMLRNYNVTYVKEGSGQETLHLPMTILLNANGHMLFISQSEKCFSITAGENITYMDKPAASELARKFWKDSE